MSEHLKLCRSHLPKVRSEFMVFIIIKRNWAKIASMWEFRGQNNSRPKNSKKVWLINKSKQSSIMVSVQTETGGGVLI